jgi:hypothetical protein
MFERDNGPNVQKGKYAQALAQAIAADGSVFEVPQYIRAALEFITED